VPTETRSVVPQSPVGDGRTVYAALADRAALDPDAEYLRDDGASLSYGEMLASADCDAARLCALGVGAGDAVVLWLPNGARWASLFFACARIGALAVTAGTRLRAIDLRHILADSGARVLVFAPHALEIDFGRMVGKLLHDRANGALPDLAHVVSVGGAEAGATALDSVEPAAPQTPLASCDEPMVVCYTSGTTGRPKGCVHTHRTLVRNGTVAVGSIGLTGDDRVLCPVPFAHVFGFHMGLLECALGGAALVNAEPYEANRLLDLAEHERATVLYMVPAMAHEVVCEQRRRPRDLSAVRLIVLAGSPVPPELRRRVTDPVHGLGGGLSIVYGCTEAPTLAQLTPGDPAPPREDSVGRPTDGVVLRVCRPATEADLPAGEVGEILVRGYNTMLGYLGDAVATAQKYRGGWLVTGDLGWMDDAGFLYIAGRSSEMFLVGGFNAYPREIEGQLEELEGVIEAAVVGVPDQRLGRVPMAWVTSSSPALAEQDVVDWGRRNLASYKRPRYVRVVASLPRTANGKLSRVKLEHLAQRALPHLDWESQDA
jgi:HIP---CoA ligase